MNETNRADNAAREAERGDDALRAAEALVGLGLNNDAVSRAYYAAFHYSRALLLLEGRGLADYDSRDRLSGERAVEELSAAQLFVAEARGLLPPTKGG